MGTKFAKLLRPNERDLVKLWFEETHKARGASPEKEGRKEKGTRCISKLFTTNPNPLMKYNFGYGYYQISLCIKKLRQKLDVVHFRRLEKPNEDYSSIGMSGMLTYEDVTKRIASHLASLAGALTPLQKREKLYLLSVGYYRSGDYLKSRQLLDRCLEQTAVRKKLK
ncbi:hypothetical protein MKW98_031646 [Papaver atlanticum]|uniref:Uncharacterized protein n=1 Tax=Papaver atlanticum TaxID=357466 RepID=A0AAD4X9H8_9MAGN|nr:hypothetical protein MKW98_031646 [Papaver atlanticum]